MFALKKLIRTYLEEKHLYSIFTIMYCHKVFDLVTVQIKFMGEKAVIKVHTKVENCSVSPVNIEFL